MLRSGDRPGLEQELWGLLATYQVLRMAMTDAAQIGGLDPDRASFTIALETARDTLTTATGVLPATGPDGRIDLAGAIGRAVLAHPLPARRARYSARKVKSPISRYHARPADDDRPLVTTSIDTVTTHIHEPVAGQRLTPNPLRRTRPGHILRADVTIDRAWPPDPATVRPATAGAVPGHHGGIQRAHDGDPMTRPARHPPGRGPGPATQRPLPPLARPRRRPDPERHQHQQPVHPDVPMGRQGTAPQDRPRDLHPHTHPR